MFKIFAIAVLLTSTSAVKINKNEMDAAGKDRHYELAQIGQGEPKCPEWEEVLQELDQDMSGTISWPELEAFFKKVAKEHDYQLTQKDLEQIHEVFKMVDTDKSGEVDKKKFEAAIANAGALGQKTRAAFKKLAQIKAKQPAPPTWNDILEVLDEDQNGQISWEEIEIFISQLEEEHGVQISENDEKEMKKVFDMVDSDGSGQIDKQEFEAAMVSASSLAQTTKQHLTRFAQMKSRGDYPPSWLDVLAEIDADNSGTVTWGEVKHYVKKIEHDHGVTIPQKDVNALKAAFDEVDTDGSGVIDKFEFESAVARRAGLAQVSKK